MTRFSSISLVLSAFPFRPSLFNSAIAQNLEYAGSVRWAERLILAVSAGAKIDLLSPFVLFSTVY
jgi:hypothetical protein